MERREFIRNSIFGITGLAGLVKLPVNTDPVSEIKKEIENLMKKTNTIIEYSHAECKISITHNISTKQIWGIEIPLEKLKEIKNRLLTYEHYHIEGNSRVMFIHYGQRGT